MSFVLGCLSLAGLHALGRPHPIFLPGCDNQTAAWGTLRTLVTSEAQFQSACIVDQDGDKIGEFGFLQELSGTAPPRGQTQPTSPAFITSVMGTTALDNGGIAGKTGYNFALYLPDGKGGWTREASPLLPPDPSTAHAQEKRWIAYAWPASFGNSGVPAYAVTEKGVLWGTANDSSQPYDGMKRVPAADAAFAPGKNDLPAEFGKPATDGQIWLPASE